MEKRKSGEEEEWRRGGVEKRRSGEEEEWRGGGVEKRRSERRAVGEKKTGTDMGVSGIQSGNGNARC